MTVLVIQRASINFYPPIINQTNIMVEAGIPVKILDGGHGSRPEGLHPDIKLIRPLAHLSANNSAKHSKLYQQQLRLSGNIQFINAVNKEQKTTNIYARIGYDSPAISLLGFSRFSGHTIYHFHEHPETAQASNYLQLQHKIARHHARRAELIVIPDKHRALALQQEEHLTNTPIVVPNCPRRLKELPTGKLRTIVQQHLPSTKYIVLFQGAISTNYYADTIIRSIPYWPLDATMVFLGPVYQETKEQLLQVAQESKVTNRLIFLPQVEYSQLFNYTVDADLALSLIKPITFNFAHMSGASNKRYEFMACGIPQLSNIGPGMKELIDDNEIGLCINPEDIEAIGNSVKNLLLNKPLRQTMSERARSLHLQKYNYDLQFAPIVERLLRYQEGA